MLFFPTVSEDFEYFRSQGYDGSLNDMHYKAMGDLTHTGSLTDRIHKFLVSEYGSFYEAMRDLRNSSASFVALDYGVLTKQPAYSLDFINEYYRAAGVKSNLNPAVTHTRAGQATMTDGYGAEEVTNGTFDNGTTGWVATACNISVVNGAMRITDTDGSIGYVYQRPTLEIGKTYLIQVDVVTDNMSGNMILNVGTSSGSGQLGTLTMPSIGTYSFTFTATIEQPYVSLRNTSAGAGDYWDVDNVSVKEVPEIKWAPHNLLPYSEDFSNSVWLKSNTTVVSNVTEAPNGESSADLVYPTISGSYRSIRGLGGYPQSGKTTFSVWLKYSGFRYLKALSNTGSASTDFTIDLVDGVLTNVQSAVTASMIEGSNGWYKVTWEETDTARFYLYFSDNGSGTSSTANGTNGIYIWGAHAFRSDLGGMVDNPATGDSYVRTAGKTIGSEQVTNGDFATDTDWTKGTGWTISGGVASQNSPSTGNFRQTNVFVTGKTYELSYTLSGNTSSGMFVYADNSNNSNQIDYETTTGEKSVVFVAQGDAITFRTNSGGGSACILDKVSVKEADVNPATARYLPRVGHHIYNGDAWVNEGVLHESEARTNLLTESNVFTAGGDSTVTANSAVSPTGETNAVLADTVSVSSANAILLPTYNVTAGTSSVISLYVKSVAGNGFLAFFFRTNGQVNQTKVWFNLNNGTKGTQGVNGGTSSVSDFGITDVGNGWYRLFVVGADSTYTIRNPFIFSTASDNSSTRDASGEVLVFGTQAEAGSTPSSYIPTSGSTVTRAAETLTVPSANLPWPTPVVIGSEAWVNPTITDPAIWSWDGDTLTATGDGTSDTARGDAVISGSLYLVTYNVTKISGLGQVRIGNSFIETIAGNGVREKLVIAGDTTGLTFTDSGSFVGTIDNISVKEINPLSVSIQMDGRMTYADTNSGNEVRWAQWGSGSDPTISAYLRTTSSRTGNPTWQQVDSVATSKTGYNTAYSPSINVPFNIASRHGSTFINGAVDGTALTADTTPTALPDLSATDLNLANKFMGTIGKFRVWSDDLTDTGIATASAPSTEPSLQLTFDGSATSSFTVLDWSE